MYQGNWGTLASAHTDIPFIRTNIMKAWGFLPIDSLLLQGAQKWWKLMLPRSTHPGIQSLTCVDWFRTLYKMCHVLLSDRVRILENWHCTRVFQFILNMSVESTILWQKIWFTLHKEHGDMVKLHNLTKEPWVVAASSNSAHFSMNKITYLFSNTHDTPCWAT